MPASSSCFKQFICQNLCKMRLDQIFKMLSKTNILFYKNSHFKQDHKNPSPQTIYSSSDLKCKTFNPARVTPKYNLHVPPSPGGELERTNSGVLGSSGLEFSHYQSRVLLSGASFERIHTVEPEKQSKEVISEENQRRQEQHRKNLDKYPSKFLHKDFILQISGTLIFLSLFKLLPTHFFKVSLGENETPQIQFLNCAKRILNIFE